MAKIHLIRHGEAAAGFGTHRDPGLSAAGRDQAASVGEAIASIGPLPIVSSPMKRAQETAAPLARLWNDALVTIEPRVAEIPSPTDNLDARAAWLGQAMQGLWSDLPNEQIQWRANLGTCLLEFEQDCVIFSHYVAINAAVGIATDDQRMRIFAAGYCSVTILDNAGGQLSVDSLGASTDTFIN